MKKRIALWFLLFVFIPLSAAEISFSPGVGFSLYTVRSFFEIETTEKPERPMLSQKAVTYIIPVPSIGLDIHFTHESSGFTFSIINNVGLPITLFKKGGFGNDKQHIEGSIFDGQILFGYTYGVQQPFSIHCGIGPGAALGHFWARRNEQILENVYYALTPVALHLGLQKLFTQHVGITIGIHEMLIFSGIFSSKRSYPAVERSTVNGTVGLGNTCTLRIAATFRL